MRSLPSGNGGMPVENMSESHDLLISLSERSEAMFDRRKLLSFSLPSSMLEYNSSSE